MILKDFEVNKIISILLEANSEIMRVYSNPENWETLIKNDKSPVTYADCVSNEIICKQLLDFFPNTLIISEENKEIPFEKRKNEKFIWCIDPIDGTKEFLKKNGDFAVNIALIHEKMVIAGFVGVPARKEIYWAIRGEGAFKRSHNGKVKKIEAKIFTIQDRHLKIVASRSHIDNQTNNFIDSFWEPEIISVGSSIKFLAIAEGEAHIYPRLGPTMEWDTAAPQIILEEAGGRVVNCQSLKPLCYNKENLLNPHFIAYGKVVD